MTKYFPETVTAPGSRTWDPPEILASHMADPVLSGVDGEELVLPSIAYFSD